MKSRLSSPTAPTVREWLAQGLLPHGFKPDRKTMSPTHMRELVERYPNLYRLANEKPVSPCEQFTRYAFTCGDGWFSIIDRLSAKLAADPNLVVVQV